MYIIDFMVRNEERGLLNNLNGAIESLDQQQMGRTAGNFNKDLVTALDAVLNVCTSISNRLNKLEDYVKNL